MRRDERAIAAQRVRIAEAHDVVLRCRALAVRAEDALAAEERRLRELIAGGANRPMVAEASTDA